MNRVRGKFTYANVVATLALFLVLAGGAAWAKKNLIHTNDIANKAVTGKKIAKKTIKAKNLKKNGGVTGAVVKNGSLGGDDIGDASVPGGKLTNGSVPVAKLPGEEKYQAPTLGNGGQGDCTWSDASVTALPGANPVGYRLDRFGDVHLSGLVTATPHPGVGDEECGSTAPEPDDSIEDERAFTLPPPYRPKHLTVRAVGSSAIIIGGQAPTLVPPSSVVPAGAVLASTSSGSLDVLDGIVFEAASAGVSPTAAPAHAAAPERASGHVLEALGLK